ncbi:hypothetical protein Krac_4165 [Ktedonobacter racemifer DSM 44963]|uniref:Uncharacterized protein n=1 Tax=Ktedonobacter racemifer DSM 44963 TaxID=485913 RepID=D6TYE5_KTERA|nr:hypothetical protein Krac_4165 [Ktedonobacter racemifer DSM 44963]
MLEEQLTTLKGTRYAHFRVVSCAFPSLLRVANQFVGMLAQDLA